MIYTPNPQKSLALLCVRTEGVRGCVFPPFIVDWAPLCRQKVSTPGGQRGLSQRNTEERTLNTSATYLQQDEKHKFVCKASAVKWVTRGGQTWRLPKSSRRGARKEDRRSSLAAAPGVVSCRTRGLRLPQGRPVHERETGSLDRMGWRGGPACLLPLLHSEELSHIKRLGSSGQRSLAGRPTPFLNNESLLPFIDHP